ncbi:MAG: DUF3854 domain-containing protein, partial [Fimbriimonadaceae bacterium]
ASAGFACVALPGVWNWKRRNEYEGSVTVGDLENVPIKGRDVFLAFDSDAVGKPAVRKAEKRLAGFLRSKGATVRVVRIPDPGDGSKAGLDDFLACGGDLAGLIEQARELLPEGAYGGSTEYAFEGGGTVWNRPTPDGPVSARLANFEAEITAEVELRNGVETSLAFEVEARQGGRTARRLVRPSEFVRMDWPLDLLGPRAVVEPGMGVRDRLRVAIQKLSEEPDRRIVLTSAGVHRVESGCVFAHAGGAIGSDGAADGLEVELRPNLAGYRFDRIAEDAELPDYARAVVAALDVAPLRVSAPLLGSYLRAILGEADFAVWLYGPTQSRKSSLAAALLGMFGEAFAKDRLPIEWSSTENAIESLAFEAANLPLVVDDWVAHRDRATKDAMMKKAARILRSQGNRSGRSRANADGSVRGARHVRALVVSTAETLPDGFTSEKNRTLSLQLRRDDVRNDALSRLQSAGRSGALAAGTARFIQWLIPRFEEARAGLAAGTDAAKSGDRLDEQLTQLRFAFGLFLRFAVEHGLPQAEADAAMARFERGLAEARAEQLVVRREADPVDELLRTIVEGFRSGACHVLARNGRSAPDDGESWGWRPGGDGLAAFPGGAMIGYLDEEDGLLLLLPGAAEAFVEQTMLKRGRTLGTSFRAAMAQAMDKGFVVPDGDRRRASNRRCGGGAARVYPVKLAALDALDGGESESTPGAPHQKCVADVACVAEGGFQVQNGPEKPQHGAENRVAACCADQGEDASCNTPQHEKPPLQHAFDGSPDVSLGSKTAQEGGDATRATRATHAQAYAPIEENGSPPAEWVPDLDAPPRRFPGGGR